MNHDDREIEQESALAYPPRHETDGRDAPARFQAIMAEAKSQLEQMLPPDAEVRVSYRPREGKLEPEIVCRMDLRTPDASGKVVKIARAFTLGPGALLGDVDGWRRRKYSEVAERFYHTAQRLHFGAEQWTAAWKNRRPGQPQPFKIELGKPVDFQAYS